MNLLPLPAVHYLPMRTLSVGRDVESFRVSGAPRVDLRTLGPLRRIVRLFVETHCESPGRCLSLDEIFDVAWFGEAAEACSITVRRGRVYPAISKLRRMGLASVLRSTDAGYRLDPHCCLITESALVSRPPPCAMVA
jgi:hypothetical protein